jgi:hypothetical protein
MPTLTFDDGTVFCSVTCRVVSCKNRLEIAKVPREEWNQERKLRWLEAFGWKHVHGFSWCPVHALEAPT